MSYAGGDLLRVTLTWRDTRFTGVFRNIIMFRGFTGEVPQTEAGALMEAMASEWLSRLYPNLCTTTYLRHIRLQNVRKSNSPDEEVLYGPADHAGGAITETYDVPQAAACFTRRSYTKGRKGIGHFYLGPLPSRFINKGELLIDPVGFGDLNDVMDALGDPWGTSDVQFRPIVHPGDSTVPTAAMDIRTHTMAPLAVYLKSRRAGIGE